jgi:two-component system LytT family response regulator
MPLVKTILVDDEQDSLDTIELLLRRHCPQVEVAATFTNPQKAIAAINQKAPDLLLLDIQMPGLTGFELLEKLPAYRGRVIFITAHSNYAIRAFKFSAVDYLLKPVDVTELKQAIDKFSHQNGAAQSPLLRELNENIQLFAKPAISKICISTSEGIEVIPLDALLHLQSERSYTILKLKTGKEVVVSNKSLKDFEAILPPDEFMRIHTSHIIKLSEVVKYLRTDGGSVVLSNGAQLPLSRANKEAFLEKFTGA